MTLARQQAGVVAPDIAALRPVFVPFSAHTRMSGVDLRDGDNERSVRKGAAEAVRRYVTDRAGTFPDAVSLAVEDVARAGSTPLVVADTNRESVRVLGVVELKDIVKTGIRERFGELRKMGIKTVMITGDNRLTAHPLRPRRARRLPGRSHAGSQAQADPPVPGRRPAGGDDGRRYQRCAGAGPG